MTLTSSAAATPREDDERADLRGQRGEAAEPGAEHQRGAVHGAIS